MFATRIVYITTDMQENTWARLRASQAPWCLGAHMIHATFPHIFLHFCRFEIWDSCELPVRFTFRIIEMLCKTAVFRLRLIRIHNIWDICSEPHFRHVSCCDIRALRYEQSSVRIQRTARGMQLAVIDFRLLSEGEKKIDVSERRNYNIKMNYNS